VFSPPDRHSGAARISFISSVIETVCGLRLRLALLIILAVALPTRLGAAAVWSPRRPEAGI